ncbi:MAG: formylglycine-generating enzyme family protein [Desulfuromonadaceae bacterium]|nr:formylglycine-generating enzyme family protein [Desulfuromonadaceae bacterium]
MSRNLIVLLTCVLFSTQPALAGFISGFEPVWDYGRKPVAAGATGGKSFTDPTTGMEFVLVKGGCFQMGSNKGDSDEKPVHEVCVDDFYMGKYEVTQGQWQKVTGSNPAHVKKGNNYPVEKVSWNDVQGYLRQLNQRSGKTFRLPTEAEWEYAARSGGKSEKYSGSNDVDAVAWYNGNSGNQTHPVGQKQPNGLGLYDMSGNVWEWCQDWYDSGYYTKSPRQNPQGPSGGSFRVERGGGWNNGPRGVRSAYRIRSSPGNRSNYLGFRLVTQDRG